MLVYRDRAERAKGLRERSSLTLEDICGLEPGLAYEGLAHTLAILCLSQAVMLGFDSREAMCAWDARIRYALGEGERSWSAWHGLRPRHGGGEGDGDPGHQSGLRGGDDAAAVTFLGTGAQMCTPFPGECELSTGETPNPRGEARGV